LGSVGLRRLKSLSRIGLRQRLPTVTAKLPTGRNRRAAGGADQLELRSALLAEADAFAILEATLRAAHQPSWAISVSACSSQYVIPISRYIVIAMVRCSCAWPRLLVRR